MRMCPPFCKISLIDVNCHVDKFTDNAEHTYFPCIHCVLCNRVGTRLTYCILPACVIGNHHVSTGGVCVQKKKKQEGKHMTALFSSHSIKSDTPVILSSIFSVPVVNDDGFSIYGCQNCLGSTCSLHDKFCKLRSMAEASYRNANTAGSFRFASCTLCFRQKWGAVIEET